MLPMKKINFKEALIIGIGLNARLATEIIVAQLLYGANIIDLKLSGCIRIFYYYCHTPIFANDTFLGR